jgi:hypothetical protein
MNGAWPENKEAREGKTGKTESAAPLAVR